MFGILAPATVEHHATVGGTYTFGGKHEVTAAYMHAFDKKIDGTYMPGMTATLQMYEDSFSLAYALKM